MNGRIYDPTLGRFLQADPFIQAPLNTQNYNRYSYVLNNPLKYTDPSGYLFGIWAHSKAQQKTFKALGPELSGILIGFASAACGVGAPACARYLSYNNAIAQGATTTGALKASFVAAASVYTFQQIGAHYKGLGAANVDNVAWGGGQLGDYVDFGGNLLTKGQVAGQIASHAVAGGAIAALSGGKFGHGFFSAGVTKGLGGAFLPGGSDLSGGDIVKGTVVSSVIGGKASVISGSKFANGASTAAFQYLFNQARTGLDELRKDLKIRKIAVIGENMTDRVYPFAEAIGGETFTPSRWFNENEMDLLINENIDWLVDKMDRGYVIIDVGPDPNNQYYPEPTSEYYIGELTHVLIRQYEYYYPIWGSPRLMNPNEFNNLTK